MKVHKPNFIEDFQIDSGDDLDESSISNTTLKSNENEWSKIQRYPDGTLTVDGTAHITWNISEKPNAKLTLTENVTFDAPTGLDSGSWALLEVVQDSTSAGNFTISWNTTFKFPDDAAPTIATTAGYKTILFFKCDGTNMYGDVSYKEGS